MTRRLDGANDFDDALEVVSSVTGVPRRSILIHSRQQARVDARQIVYCVMVDVFGWSYPRIARAVRRDHTTVLRGVGAAKGRMPPGSIMSEQFFKIVDRLRNR